MPILQQVAPFVPGGAAALTAATPVLQRAGVAGSRGLGALYQAPDGTVYQVQGLGQDEDIQGLGEDDVTQMMGIGHVGEVRQGPDANLYQWVQGVDGLGNPVGFWRALRRLRRGIRRVARKALPIAQQITSMIPHPAAQTVATALTAATPVLQRAGVADSRGLGALYQAPDGTVYQVQGLGQDEELGSLSEDEELQGVAEDDEIQGIAQDEELQGLAEDEDLQGLDQGYVREDGMSGLEAYLPEQPARTRWFTPPNQPPDMWKPLW